eukprot:5686629-Amphidinium_carterae.1
MEITTTYRQQYKETILDKQDYKQRHFHDYSGITTNIDVNEAYAKRHHATRITKIMKDTQDSQKNRSTKLSTHPNLRNLTDMQQQLPQPRQVYDAEHVLHYSDMEEESDEFGIDEYDTNHQSAGTTRASRSNIQQRKVKQHSSKDKAKRDYIDQ